MLGRLFTGKSISDGKSLFHSEKVAREFVAGFRLSKKVQSVRFMSQGLCHFRAVFRLYPKLTIIHKVIRNELMHCISNRCLKKLHHKCHLNLYSPGNGGSKEKVWVRNPRVSVSYHLHSCIVLSRQEIMAFSLTWGLEDKINLSEQMAWSEPNTLQHITMFCISQVCFWKGEIWEYRR